MKSIKIILITLMMAVLLSGCGQIATPDELLVQPALSLEKKAMKDAIDSFLPEGCSVITLTKNDRIAVQDSFSKIDLNGDGGYELIFFYKDKKTKVISGRILREKDGVWSKLYDLPIDASDILRYKVLDLDDDGKKEIIIGSYSSDIMQDTRNLKIFGFRGEEIIEILNMPYYSMDVEDMNRDRQMEMAILFKRENSSENRVKLVHLKNHKIITYDEIAFAASKEPYSVRIGRIYDNVMAIFVDSYTSGYEGYTDIFFMGNRKMRDFEEVHKYKLDSKASPILSEDIDKDGIIEIGTPFFLPQNEKYENDSTRKLYAVSYYKIRRDGMQVFVKQLYMDYDIGFTFNVPKIFPEHYDIDMKENDTSAEFSFYSSEGKKYKLFEVTLVSKKEWEKKKNIYQFLSENQEQIIAGKVEDHSRELFGEDKELYLQMRNEILELNKVVTGLDVE